MSPILPPGEYHSGNSRGGTGEYHSGNSGGGKGLFGLILTILLLAALISIVLKYLL